MSVSPRFLEPIFLLNSSSYPYDVAWLRYNAKPCLRRQRFYTGDSYMQVNNNSKVSIDAFGWEE